MTGGRDDKPTPPPARAQPPIEAPEPIARQEYQDDEDAQSDIPAFLRRQAN
jgi:hypothetical protein